MSAGAIFLHIEEFSDILCFVRATISGAILPDYSSAAIFCTAPELTQYYTVLAESLTSIARSPASASTVMGQRNKLAGLTSGAPLCINITIFCYMTRCGLVGVASCLTILRHFLEGSPQCRTLAQRHRDSWHWRRGFIPLLWLSVPS
jgi:hypothetical protein